MAQERVQADGDHFEAALLALSGLHPPDTCPREIMGITAVDEIARSRHIHRLIDEEIQMRQGRNGQVEPRELLGATVSAAIGVVI